MTPIGIIRQIISLILPLTVLILVPIAIEPDAGYKHLNLALLFLVPGFILFCITVGLFIIKGKGTLAPWSPTLNLVLDGPYAYVRNPMILSVLILLCCEAILFGSWLLLIWAIVFFGINHLFFLVYEEPNLERRHGEPYLRYKNAVPRWIPRLKPYRQADLFQ